MSLLRALEGIEIQGLIVPYQNTGRPVEIEMAKISWGEFIGAFPTQVRAALRLSGPITSGDGEPFTQLLAAGMTAATVDLDAGARWSEASRLVVLSPFSAKLANVGSIEVNATLGNVPPSVFTLDAATFMAATAAVEAGPIEIAVRDLGGLDLIVADVARKQNLSLDAARRMVVETATQPAAALVPSSPDLSGVADAVAHFIESPGGKLSISITPKRRVPLLPLLVTAQANPAAILAQFRIRPSVTWSAALLSLRGVSPAAACPIAASPPTTAADCPKNSRRDSLDMSVEPIVDRLAGAAHHGAGQEDPGCHQRPSRLSRQSGRHDTATERMKLSTKFFETDQKFSFSWF